MHITTSRHSAWFKPSVKPKTDAVVDKQNLTHFVANVGQVVDTSARELLARFCIWSCKQRRLPIHEAHEEISSSLRAPVGRDKQVSKFYGCSRDIKESTIFLKLVDLF